MLSRAKLAGPALFRKHLRAFGKCTNGVALSKSRPNLASVQLKIDPSGSPYCSDHVRSSHDVIFCTFECSSSSVLCRILLKLHILTRLIESFPTLYSLWNCIEVKLSISLGAHAQRSSMEKGSTSVIF